MLGGVYFFLLYRATCLHLDQVAAIRVVPVHLFRLGLVAATFWAIVQAGAVPLLLAFCGFLAARCWAQLRLGVG